MAQDSETRDWSGRLIGKTVSGSKAGSYTDPSKSRVSKGSLTAKQGKATPPRQNPGESSAAYAERVRKWRAAQAGAVEK